MSNYLYLTSVKKIVPTTDYRRPRPTEITCNLPPAPEDCTMHKRIDLFNFAT